jgi:hypothetical protein
LIELSHSKNETIALQATRELLDRLIGKPAISVDTTHTRVDIGAMYLKALQQVNATDSGSGPSRMVQPGEPT